jgi:protocatechuate 3,4-dioxygenase beta subunit
MPVPTVISGQVVDTQGHPVAEARVFFGSGPGEVPDIAALTDTDGRFTLTTPVPGEYRVVAVADGYIASETAVTTTEATASEVQIELRAATS